MYTMNINGWPGLGDCPTYSNSILWGVNDSSIQVTVLETIHFIMWYLLKAKVISVPRFQQHSGLMYNCLLNKINSLFEKALQYMYIYMYIV
jgi:hypothetical protein